MDQTACEATNPFSDKVSCPILTKNSHLSNKFKDNFILTLLECQIGWKCVGFMSATPHTIRKY